MIRRPLMVGVLVAGLGWSAADASVTFFKDEAAFDLAAGTRTYTEDDFFPNIASGQSIVLASGVVSANAGGVLAAHFVASGLYFNSLDGDGSGASLTSTWTFPHPVRAVAFDYFSLEEGRITLEVGSAVRVIRLPGEARDGFLGFLSDTPITSIVFDNVTAGFVDSYQVDNLRFDSAAPVPLPAAGPLLLGGLGLLARRRRGA